MGQIISRSQACATRTDTRSVKTLKPRNKKSIGLLDKEYNAAINMFGSFNLIDFNEIPDEIVPENYLLDQIQFLKNWEQPIRKAAKYRHTRVPLGSFQESLKHKWKSQIRQGVADNHIRAVILSMIPISHGLDDYNRCILQSFSGEFPDEVSRVPSYSSNRDIDAVIKKNYLIEDGKAAMRRILIAIHRKHSNIVFAPHIPAVVSMLLLYLQEFETYFVMDKLIINSEEMKEDRLIRWHLTLSESSNVRMVSAIFHVAKRLSPKLERYFDKNSEAMLKEIGKMFNSLFIGYFKLPELVRILICYMSEGIKVLFRVILAIFLEVEIDLIDSLPEDTERLLIKYCQETTKINQLLNSAFRLPLSRYNNSFIYQAPPTSFEQKQFILITPKLNFESRIITKPELDFIWTSLSSRFAASIPELIFSNFDHGTSFTSLKQRISYHSSLPLLIFLESVMGEKCGVLLDSGLVVKKDYQGTDDTMVFAIAPELKSYRSSGINNMYYYLDNDIFLVGGQGNGPALTIQPDLSNCSTRRCLTFNNEPLASENFICKACEVWVLI
jgi:hypothetical protein